MMTTHKDLPANLRTLFSEAQASSLLRNGVARANYEASEATGEPHNEPDPAPVALLFYSPAVWLLAEMDPEDPDIVFGLCDLGVGFPEIGQERLSRLVAAFPEITLSKNFKAEGPLSAYMEVSRKAGHARHPTLGHNDDLECAPFFNRF